MEEKTLDNATNSKTKILKNKRLVVIIVAAVVAALATIATICIININSDMKYQTILQLEDRIGKPDENWSVTTADSRIATAEFKTDMGFEGYSLVLEFHHPGETELLIKNADGQDIKYSISIDQNQQIKVQNK